MFPAIVLRYDEFKNYKGFKDLKDRTDILRKAAKKAVNYSWDNPHYWIQDAFGNIVVSFLPHEARISLYKNNSTSITYFDNWEAFLDQIGYIVDEVSNGNLYCDKCHKWKPAKKMKHFSFAGIVCPKCFDKNQHLPPDTRGD